MRLATHTQEVPVVLILKRHQSGGDTRGRDLELRRCIEGRVLLTTAEIRKVRLIVQADRQRTNDQRAGFAAQIEPLLLRYSRLQPFRLERFTIELIAPGEVAAHGSLEGLGSLRSARHELRTLVHVRNRLALLENHRPAVLPGDRQQERLAPRVVFAFAVCARREEHGPPRTIGRFDHIGMTCIDHGIRACRRQVALRENGIAGVRLERTPGRTAAKDHFGVIDLRAAFRAHEVVPAVALVEVRAFDPDRFVGEVHPAIDDDFARPHELACGDVELLNPDGAMAFVQRLAFGRAVVQDVRLAVVIEKERGIDPIDLRQPLRIRPGPGRIRRSHEEVSAAIDRRVDHIEHAIVELDGGCEHTTRHAEPIEVELRGTIDRVTHQLPMHEVRTFQDRDAWEVGERRVHQIELIACARDARVGIKTGQDRIAILTGSEWRIENLVTTGVLEPVERHRLGMRRNAQSRATKDRKHER